MHAAEQMWETG